MQYRQYGQFRNKTADIKSEFLIGEAVAMKRRNGIARITVLIVLVILVFALMFIL